MFRFPPCPLPPASRVWLYLRDSGGDNQDLASQRAYGLAYCQHHQLQLVRVFEDNAISGGSVAGRDEFTAMIDAARQSKNPAVDGILYWDIKRFARNQLDSQYYKADLRRRGYKLVSLSDNIPDGDLSFVFEAFLEWKAQKDREDLSKDIKRGMAYIVGQKDSNGNYLGIFPGAPPTFFKGVPYNTGLKRNDGRARILQRLVPDPDTCELSPSPALRQRLAQRESERAALERKFRELQEQATARSIRVDERKILSLLAGMRDTLTDGEIRARQLILQSTVVKAELGRSSGKINYRFPLTGVLLERVNWLELNPVQVYEFEY